MSAQELYRPQFHFTPARNWMNDPNGLVYDQGEYHLFFQHNPFGDTWGHMSWGHAVSRDLVHWTQLPVAIPERGDESVFSGSAVVDTANTAGFGAGAMVAVFTSSQPAAQAQSLAHSSDRGRTWTRYAGNPVLDIGSAEFRDPKVFWYAPERKWVMAVSMAQEHKIRLYGSPNLTSWTLMSDFGPAGAAGGAWECPDLFPLKLDGGATQWVLVVSVNDGRAQLVQTPVDTLDGLRGAPSHTLPARGTSLDIRATLRPGDGKGGLKVLTGANGDATEIGYDPAREEHWNGIRR